MIVELLIQKQGCMRDEDFADLIGISESYWNMIKNGVREPTIGVLRRVVRRWPELEDDASLFLRSKLTDSESQLTGSEVA